MYSFIDDVNHILSCKKLGVTPINTPRAKRIRLECFDPDKAVSVQKMKRVSRILNKVVEKTCESDLERMKRNRKRCESEVKKRGEKDTSKDDSNFVT